MHDLGVRIVSALLVSGVLLFAAFFLMSIMYPRRTAAAASGKAGTAVATRPKNYGYLAPVARPLEWTLRGIEARTRRYASRSSWGWAIVLTTLAINLLLPFRMLAARNARAMRVLQPRIDAINARYRRKRLGMDPQQSREVSEAYKQHGASPFAGCLTALAPYAVLVAFYSVLTGIAELHGAHWLWIGDLSRPEDLPVRILPVLLIAAQWLGARSAPPAPGVDPRMARWMQWMPLAFGVALYGQPSALVLYWLTSSMLQLGQQWWLGRRYA